MRLPAPDRNSGNKPLQQNHGNLQILTETSHSNPHHLMSYLTFAFFPGIPSELHLPPANRD